MVNATPKLPYKKHAKATPTESCRRDRKKVITLKRTRGGGHGYGATEAYRAKFVPSGTEQEEVAGNKVMWQQSSKEFRVKRVRNEVWPCNNLLR
ncbi:hypothetical protein CDAR_544851 [Caerostris darwini]|uniref:Uncharacterized protein n=1 Tax=Caerostris darwini TaxID=1538125 RepID=A0AAV4PWD3_9ARAC|nr:hypothetical protein CDAR_544851 [Caerostris darwini]